MILVVDFRFSIRKLLPLRVYCHLATHELVEMPHALAENHEGFPVWR